MIYWLVNVCNENKCAKKSFKNIIRWNDWFYNLSFSFQQNVKVKHAEPPNDIFTINYTAHGIITDIPPKFKS